MNELPQNEKAPGPARPEANDHHDNNIPPAPEPGNAPKIKSYHEYRRRDPRARARDKYRQLLLSIPAPGMSQGQRACHHHLNKVAIAGYHAALSPEQVAADLRANIPQGRRLVTDREIEEQVTAGFSWASSRPVTWQPQHRPAKPVDKAAKAAAAARQAVEARHRLWAPIAEAHGSLSLADGSWWRALATVAPACLPPADPFAQADALLEAICAPADLIFVGPRDTPRGRGQAKRIMAAEAWRTHLAGVFADLRYLLEERAGIVDGDAPEATAWGLLARQFDAVEDARQFGQWAINPMTGQPDASGSYRACGCVAAHRYTLAEMDACPLEEQLALWLALLPILDGYDLPVDALIFTGGKSVHGLIRLAAADATAYRELSLTLHKRHLTPLGFDENTTDAARLSRLPGLPRLKELETESGKTEYRPTGTWQELLFLRPPPTSANEGRAEP